MNRFLTLIVLALFSLVLAAGCSKPEDKIKEQAEKIAEAAQEHKGDCAAMAEAIKPHFQEMMQAMAKIAEEHKDDPAALKAKMEELQTQTNVNDEAFKACQRDPAMIAMISEIMASIKTETE